MDESKNEEHISVLPDAHHDASVPVRSKKSFLHESFEIVKVLLISLAIVLPVRYFVVQPFIVRGASMEPNFHDGQYLIIDELTYAFRKPNRGEVIVFHYPKDPRQFFIKRIIGLPGERVRIAKGRVTVFNDASSQGVLLDENYLAPPHYPTYPDEDILLGSTEYFLMGDNRDFSSDSRIWGPMDMKFMVGRTLFRAWPLGNVGLVTN